MLIDQEIRFSLIAQNLPPSPCTVFEVGCGPGEMIRWLGDREYTIRGCDVLSNTTSMDLSWAAPGQLIRACGSRLPVADNSVDCAISCDVLEHVLPHQRAAFIRELFRITKPGGRVVLTAWFNNTFSFHVYGALHRASTGTLPRWYVEHMEIASPLETEVEAMFKEKCDDVIKQRYQGTMNLMVSVIQHVAAVRRRGDWLHRFKRLNGLAKRFDWFGKRTSCMFAGTKRFA